MPLLHSRLAWSFGSESKFIHTKLFKIMKSQESKTIEETVSIAQFMGYEVINYQHGNYYRPIYNGHKRYKTIGQQKNFGKV